MSALMNTNAALTMTRQHFRNLGLTLPAALTGDFADLDKAASRGAQPVRRSALAAAVLDALIADKDPATDATVLTELARQQLAERPNILGDEIEQRRRAILTTHAPTILDALTPVIAEADKALTTAREQIGDQLDLADGAVAQLRPAQMPAWGAAREHAARVELVAQCWGIVAQFGRLASIPHDKKPLILADLTAEQLGELGHRPKAEAVIAAGHRLALASPEEFAARCQRVDEQRQEAAAKFEAARNAALTGRRAVA
ncbi:hypothetical protein [Micromonospora coerulea]|uniref:hypothetical protein n=1 Tax=Micromonospora coerulea TaxID=47856 RepID=UPI0019052B06|nr:hypothetical protein [Micromonospora veneta]